MFLLYVKIESGNLSDIFSSVTSCTASTSGANRLKKKGKVSKDKSIISKVYFYPLYTHLVLQVNWKQTYYTILAYLYNMLWQSPCYIKAIFEFIYTFRFQITIIYMDQSNKCFFIDDLSFCRSHDHNMVATRRILLVRKHSCLY